MFVTSEHHFCCNDFDWASACHDLLHRSGCKGAESRIVRWLRRRGATHCMTTRMSQLILVGSRYQVQWGNARQVAEAVVLARVSQDNMKDREIEEVQINRNYSMAALAASTQPTARRGRV
ncbi:hypothetical protein DPMN_157427 [Dreissena polymorpha]|uniref:Uncharacterized protein n=1 Tax=Dreissena polymorpha TaxID=45954 RepID=A0A9D4EHV6_DREPO|nr:hypothetical protein DPMN_157427 [Dreissena polymorpha]